MHHDSPPRNAGLPFHLRVAAHWEVHRPKMSRGLKLKGIFHKAVAHAVNQTTAAEASLIQQGMPPLDAQDQMRQEWAFLPAERDVPNLPRAQDPKHWYLDPPEATTTPSPEMPSSLPEAPKLDSTPT